MRSRPRPGFTLIETIFAIFIFAVGALALAATTAVVIRALANAAARESATRIASNRLENLRGLSCGNARSGSEMLQGVQSTWMVSPQGQLTSAAATVTYRLNGALRTESYVTLFRCLP